MNVEIKHEIEQAVATSVPLPKVVARLRSYRDRGVGRNEILSVLEDLRREATDEATGDRILEVMDFAAGFCSAENSVWDEPSSLGEPLS